MTTTMPAPVGDPTRAGTPGPDPLAPYRAAAADLLAGARFDPNLLDDGDLADAADLLRSGTPAHGVAAWLAESAGLNAVRVAMYFSTEVRERGAAEGGGPVWRYARGEHPGASWRTHTGAGFHWASDLPFEHTDAELAEDFDFGTLSYCVDCRTRFGCTHQHAPDVRAARGAAPALARPKTGNRARGEGGPW